MTNLRTLMQENCPLEGFLEWINLHSYKDCLFDYTSSDLYKLPNNFLSNHGWQSISKSPFARLENNACVSKKGIVEPSSFNIKDQILPTTRFNNFLHNIAPKLQQIQKSKQNEYIDESLLEDEDNNSKKRKLFLFPLPNLKLPKLPKLKARKSIIPSSKLPKWNWNYNWNPTWFKNPKSNLQTDPWIRQIPNFLQQTNKTAPVLQKVFNGGVLIALMLGAQLIITPMLNNNWSHNFRTERNAPSLQMKDFQIGVDGIFQTLSNELKAVRAQAATLELQLKDYKDKIANIQNNPNASLLDVAAGLKDLEAQYKVLDSNVLVTKPQINMPDLIKDIGSAVRSKWNTSRKTITTYADKTLDIFANETDQKWKAQINAFQQSQTSTGNEIHTAITKYQNTYSKMMQEIIQKAKKEFEKDMAAITYADINDDNPGALLDGLKSVDAFLQKKTREQLQKHINAVNVAIKEAQKTVNKQMFLDVLGDGTPQGLQTALGKFKEHGKVSDATLNVFSKIAKDGDITSAQAAEKIIDAVKAAQNDLAAATAQSKLSGYAQWCYTVDERGNNKSSTPTWSAVWKNMVTLSTCNGAAIEIAVKTMTWEEQKQLLIILGSVLAAATVVAAVVTAPVWAPAAFSVASAAAASVSAAASTAAATVSGVATGIASGVSTMVGTGTAAAAATVASAKATLATVSIGTIASVHGVAAAATTVAAAHPITTVAALAGGALILGSVL